MKHRLPPLPATMTEPRRPGWCRWCGRATGSKRRTWHAECVSAYFITTRSKDQRKAVFARDKGVCAACGTDTLALALAVHPHHLHGYLRQGDLLGHYWQADHIVALVNASRDLTMWSLANLQTLCTACHKAKTKRDCAIRRRTRA